MRDDERACPPGGRRHTVADLMRDGEEVRQGASVSIAASCASTIEIDDGAGHWSASLPIAADDELAEQAIAAGGEHVLAAVKRTCSASTSRPPTSPTSCGA